VYPDLEADAVTAKVPVVPEENVEVNRPSESVVPEVGFNDGPVGLLLSVTEAPGTALPLEVTVTVIVEGCEVVMLPGFAVTWTESDREIGTYVAVKEPAPLTVAVVDALVELVTRTPPEVPQPLNRYPEGGFAVTIYGPAG